MQVYNINAEPNCFINKLVSSLTSDDLYQKNINKLIGSNEKDNINKANLITHTINNIQIYNDNFNPLFLAKDIAILTGISHISYLIRKFDSNEVEHGLITQNEKLKKVMFLTKNGVIRCCFHSKSPFAQLFKNFIYEISNYMIENETDKIKKIAEMMQFKNSKLVSDGLYDLSKKIIELENKYKYELERNITINKLYDDECSKGKLLESENTIIQVDNSYQTMIIEQLKLEKNKFESKIKAMNSIDNELQDYSVDNELKLIKEKLMIPMFIYILSPEYLYKLTKNNDDNYTKFNYSRVFEHIDNIDQDELLYYFISFARKIDKPMLKLAYTYYIFDKKHYNNVIINLTKETNNLSFKKMVLYHTSLDDIKNITINEQEKILKYFI